MIMVYPPQEEKNSDMNRNQQGTDVNMERHGILSCVKREETNSKIINQTFNE